MRRKEHIITFKGFTKKFKNNVVGPIDLAIEQGKFVALLGSSGSGKTVILDSMMGLIKKYKGTITFAGYNRKRAKSYKANASLGVYQQVDFSLETLTCYDYLKMRCNYTGLKKENQKEVLEFWMKYFDLWESRKKRIQNFSLGMKNRVNLILCFLNNPDIYILDEPGANLDSMWRNKINNLFRELKSLNKTLIVSSHNINEIIDLIDNYIVVYNGSKIFEGSKEELNIYTKYKIFLSEKFDVKEFREFLDEKGIRTFKYDEEEISIIFATKNLLQINWSFLYFIKKGIPIINVTKLSVNMESIHKALEDQISFLGDETGEVNPRRKRVKINK
ncbi:ABC transporter ATP-binding protein [Spiroplasma chinense]|uniref:ABC transporter ATP-binding protein n=1 Tax=Spiroplasma chinense TaxID=216932 RepID=A0A5B9Y3Y8_9MOLU|nr:ABC transporter ATP-binding protein [Spiroplasma chinense]QEH61389.1 ABC transporter ATP-binding protein [Spiroplasma chinense]